MATLHRGNFQKHGERTDERMGRNSHQLQNPGLTVKCWSPQFCFKDVAEDALHVCTSVSLLSGLSGIRSDTWLLSKHMPSLRFAEEITKAFSEVKGNHKSHTCRERGREGPVMGREPGMGMRRGVRWV